MAQITINTYTKTERTVDVIFPFYYRDVQDYGDGAAYNEYLMLREDGHALEVVEDIDSEGFTTYQVATEKQDVARAVSRVFDERSLNEGNLKSGRAQITAEDFKAKLDLALAAVRALAPAE